MVFVAAWHFHTLYISHDIIEELLATQCVIEKLWIDSLILYSNDKHIRITSAITVSKPELFQIGTNI